MTGFPYRGAQPLSSRRNISNAFENYRNWASTPFPSSSAPIRVLVTFTVPNKDDRRIHPGRGPAKQDVPLGASIHADLFSAGPEVRRGSRRSREVVPSTVPIKGSEMDAEI